MRCRQYAVWCRRVTTACALPLLLPALPASGQMVASTLNDLRFTIKAGDTVYVTAEDGQEREARIVDLSDSSLVVSIDGSRSELAEGRVRRIRQRVPDRLRNGALIGFLVGAGSMTSVVGVLESPKGSCKGGCIAGAALAYGGLGALVGVGLDALHKGKKTIYQRPESAGSLVIQPLLSDSKGLSVSFRF